MRREHGLGSPLPDGDERRWAAMRRDSNLVVLAGAGTGKTSLLVERALAAIAEGAVTVDRVAALTFTEKAAGEMRERLALALERLHSFAAGETPDGEGEAERAWCRATGEGGVDAATVGARALAALEDLDRATVQTIHGFASVLLRSDPAAGRVDPRFVVDAGEKADVLRREAWEAFVAAELGHRASRADLWRALLGRAPLALVERAALALAASTIPAEQLRPPYPLPSAREIFGPEARRLASEIEELLRAQRGLRDSQLRFFEGLARALRRLVEAGHAELVAEVRADRDLERQIAPGAAPRGFARLEGVRAEDATRLAGDARRLVRALLGADDETVRLLLEAVAPFVETCREALLRRGIVTFDDLLRLARDLLRDHPTIRRRIKQRYRMLLVDEFQDIDPLQYEIVLFLAERVEDDARDAFSARLEPGKLFVVGDAKQSIYRFRGADYAAYARAVGGVLADGGAELTLSANFRSLPGILDPVNALFDAQVRTSWEAGPYQPDYRPVLATRLAATAGPSIEIWTLATEGGARAGARRQAEGEAIAAEIEDLVAAGRARYRDVTVLLRAYTSLAAYLRPLRRRGVPFVVDGGREFLDRPEVSHLLAALRALSQPSDPAALLAFLRSPAGGVPDTELAAYAAAGGRWDWRAELDAAAPAGLARAFGLLRETARAMRDLPADAAVRQVLERTLLLPLDAAAFEGPQRVANLLKLAAAAGELARDGRLSLEQVVEALGAGRFAGIESDAPLADDTIDAVRITTIHRMKGLESPLVFLPDLAREPVRGPRDRTLARLLHHDAAGALLALRVEDLASAGAVWCERENQRHETAEELRVLYVALTRARDHLVLVAGASRQAAWIEALAPWGYDADDPPPDGALLCEGRVLHRIVRAGETPDRAWPAATRPAPGARASYESVLKELREQAARPLLLAPSAAEPRADERPRSSSPTRAGGAARDLGRVAGAVVHRLLARWGGATRSETLAELARGCRAAALTEGLDRNDLLRETGPLVSGFLDSPLASRLRAIEVLGREIPVLARLDGERATRGRIDLLYRDAEGRIVVADFKTDRETDPARLREVYGAQLAAYAGAVRAALDLAELPRQEIWSLRAGSITVL